jgi:TonB family protein
MSVDVAATLAKPAYPASALAAGEGGVVMLKLRVGSDGRVLESRFDAEGSTVAEDSPLVGAAREASMKWLLGPAMEDGIAVEGWVQVPVRFDPDPAGGA